MARSSLPNACPYLCDRECYVAPGDPELSTLMATIVCSNTLHGLCEKYQRELKKNNSQSELPKELFKKPYLPGIPSLT